MITFKSAMSSDTMSGEKYVKIFTLLLMQQREIFKLRKKNAQTEEID